MPDSTDQSPGSVHWWRDAGSLTHVAVYLVILAAGWYMLKELAVLLRPLLLAVLLCYVLVPLRTRVQAGRSQLRAMTILVGTALVVLLMIGFLVYGSVLELNEEMPRLAQRAEELTGQWKSYTNDRAPIMNTVTDELVKAGSKGEKLISQASAKAMSITADIFLEGLVVSLYVIFLLVEGQRLQGRVELGFTSERAKQILEVVHRINLGIADYLRAKVKASLLLSLPVGLLLFAFGVKFAMFWAMLTFFCNFIPYVGSVIACGSPVVFSFLDLPLGWQPIAVAISLIACHLGSASFVEPTMIGKAVGLSPLVILISLTFWGLCWGLVGMFLAVPLSVTMKIIMDNLEPTKPIAKLLGDE